MPDNSNRPLISVITPTYNSAEYVERTIDSIMSQTYQNFEYFITDDGSTDNTRAVIEKTLEKYVDAPQMVHYFPHEKNTGFAWSEELLPLLNGKYVCLIAGDDFCLPERFQKQVEFLESTGDEYAACFTGMIAEGKDKRKNAFFERIMNNEDQPREVLLRRFLSESNFLCAPAMMYRLDVYRKLGGYNYKYRYAQDYDLWVRTLLEYDIALLPDKLTIYSVRADSLSAPTHAGEMHNAREREEILVNAFLKMEPGLFINTFVEDLLEICPEIAGAESLSFADIKCLKFLYVKSLNTYMHYAVATRLYYAFADDPEFNRTLAEKFSLTHTDVHNIIRETNAYAQKQMVVYEPDYAGLTEELMDIIDGEDKPVTKAHIDALYEICSGLDNGRELFRGTIDRLYDAGFDYWQR